MEAPAAAGGVRLAELMAALSYAADLGLGQPIEHCMRQTVIALRLADRLGVDAEEREATYYLGLLMNAHCHADATEQARWFGDDIAFKGEGVELLGMNTAQMITLLFVRSARTAGPWTGPGGWRVSPGPASADGSVPGHALHARRAVR